MSLLESQAPGRDDVVEAGVLGIHIEVEGPNCVVRVSGELDLATAPQLESELRRVEAEPFEVITVDLSGLDFIDSSGIHCLVSAAERSRLEGDRLRLLRGSPAVDRLLELTGLNRFLPYPV